jgi:hypothetical protein
MHTNLPLISAGDYSVCRDAGDVAFVRKRASDEFFFVCPDCGCAWPEPPTPGVADTIDPPEALAPQGWMIATRGEILTAGLHSLIRLESPFDQSVFEDYAGFSKRTNS